ncbi:hypothetical protein RB195_014208 [Necator americanus]|uniref:Peptidase A2 domain-containing protein n=1 Tax=Necator americanus TaxID=51031 RepID=A0ABR1DZ46_NECAM
MNDEIVLEKRLCWKCYSNQHSSKACTRDNCPLCSELHQKQLCLSSEVANDVNESSCAVTQQYITPHNEQHNRRPSERPAKVRNSAESNRLVSPRQKNHTASNIDDQNNSRIQINSETQNHDHAEEVQITENHTTVENNLTPLHKEQRILMTAESSIWNYNTERFERAVFFFDTVAQKTIIEEEYANNLELPTLRTENCVMSGIGGKTEVFETNIVNVKIGTAYGKEIDILIQTKPILTKGFPAVRLCTKDQQLLQSRNILVCNPHIRNRNHRFWSA